MISTTNISRAGHSAARRSVWLFGALIAGAILCVAANAADARKKSNTEADANYQRERAVCLNGTSNQDRATCLREAGAALAQARRGQLVNADESMLQQNAVVRCNALPQADRNDCVRRITGDARISGSAPAGGIYRETVTIVPAPPLPPETPAPLPATPYSMPPPSPR
jgi:hypothetical protein